MKIIITNQLPESGCGVYAHYHHKRIGKNDWQYLDVRNYAVQKQKKWIDNVEDWHVQLSTVSLKHTKWWWILPSSRFSSWDFFLKPLFFSLSIIEIIEKNKYNELYLIQCPSEVIDYLREFRPCMNIKQSRFSYLSFILRKLWRVFYKSMLTQQFKLLIKTFYLFLKVKRSSMTKPKTNDIKLVIFSLFLNIEVMETKRDHFFGKIFDSVSKANTTMWLYESSLKKDKEMSIEKYLQRNNITYVIFHSLMKIGDIYKIWLICARIIFELKHLEKKLPTILVNKEQSEMFPNLFFYQRVLHSPITELCLYFSVLRLFNMFPNIKTFVYPYEEKGLERAILMACSKTTNKIKTIGYAHALHSTGALYMRRQKEDSTNSPKPDFIAATGPRSAKWQIDWAKIPPEQIKIIGSNRFISPIPLKSTAQERTNCLKVLILIGLQHEMSILENYIESDNFIFENCELWIRKNPFGWIRRQNQAIENIEKKIKQIKTDEAPILSQFEWSDLVIFSSTSAGIEAMLSGRYTINLELHDLIKVDPLEYKGDISSVMRCSSSTELKNALMEVRNMDQKEFLESINNQINFAKQIFHPVNQELLNKLING